jgi:hypothetical protein
MPGSMDNCYRPLWRLDSLYPVPGEAVYISLLMRGRVFLFQFH